MQKTNGLSYCTHDVMLSSTANESAPSSPIENASALSSSVENGSASSSIESTSSDEQDEQDEQRNLSHLQLLLNESAPSSPIENASALSSSVENGSASSSIESTSSDEQDEQDEQRNLSHLQLLLNAVVGVIQSASQTSMFVLNVQQRINSMNIVELSALEKALYHQFNTKMQQYQDNLLLHKNELKIMHDCLQYLNKCKDEIQIFNEKNDTIDVALQDVSTAEADPFIAMLHQCIENFNALLKTIHNCTVIISKTSFNQRMGTLHFYRQKLCAIDAKSDLLYIKTEYVIIIMKVLSEHKEKYTNYEIQHSKKRKQQTEMPSYLKPSLIALDNIIHNMTQMSVLTQNLQKHINVNMAKHFPKKCAICYQFDKTTKQYQTFFLHAENDIKAARGCLHGHLNISQEWSKTNITSQGAVEVKKEGSFTTIVHRYTKEIKNHIIAICNYTLNVIHRAIQQIYFLQQKAHHAQQETDQDQDQILMQLHMIAITCDALSCYTIRRFLPTMQLFLEKIKNPEVPESSQNKKVMPP